MPRVIYDTSMSLDGFITGPEPGADNPLGQGGDVLHEWMADFGDFRYRLEGSGEESNPNAKVRDALHRRTGAAIIGKTMFEVGEEPWGDNPPFAMPMFILTHEVREPITKEGGTSYTFVTDGIEAALKEAHHAAGAKDVLIVGGADIAKQYLEAGLLDEIHIHVAPILLGDGVPLFRGTRAVSLEPTATIEGIKVTHLAYRCR